MGGLLFFGMIVIPFLQPTFLYGDSNKSLPSQPHTMTEVRTADGSPAVMQKYQLPRYIPVASELYDFLQENAMPRILPDGRSESPGVWRIYISSLTILALFYACSAVLSLILQGVAAFLRAAGIMGGTCTTSQTRAVTSPALDGHLDCPLLELVGSSLLRVAQTAGPTTNGARGKGLKSKEGRIVAGFECLRRSKAPKLSRLPVYNPLPER
eukprot:gene6881-7097_t